MRTIAHLSDLHFGAIESGVAPALAQAVAAARPDIVVVSGDLTQRARTREFIEARDFLAALPKPQLVVPGNHDVPLHNLFDRFFTPLHKYRRFIASDLEPFFADDEIAIVGLNSARSNTLKDGRLNRGQIARGAARLAAASPGALRVVVTHHPFDFPAEADASVIGRAAMAMAGFGEARVDMILTGHLHRSEVSDATTRYAGRSALLVQAGTATSSRRRGEANAFNLIRVEGPRVAIEGRAYANDGFQIARTRAFERVGTAWRAVAAGA